MAITPQTVISEKSLVAPFKNAKRAARAEKIIATLGRAKAKAPDIKSKKATNIPTAVSYTHLDVYKRQIAMQGKSTGRPPARTTRSRI